MYFSWLFEFIARHSFLGEDSLAIFFSSLHFFPVTIKFSTGPTIPDYGLVTAFSFHGAIN
jgi:hypothetical protein